MPFSIRVLPLLLVPTAIYALMAFTLGYEGITAALASPFFSLGLPSGDVWTPNWGHVLFAVSAGMLFVEVVRSARPVNSSIVENSLALLLFTLQLILFLLISGFGTTEFAMIMSMTLLDFTAGAMVMIYSARRDVQYNVAA